MENKFNNRDFEQFLQKNADQYRMYPSEKVWKGIHHNLHTRHRWYGLGLALLLFTAGTVTWIMLGFADKNKPIADTEPIAIASKPAPVSTKNISITPAAVKSNLKNNDAIPRVSSNHTLFIADRQTEPGTETETQFAYINTNTQAPVEPVNSNAATAPNRKSDKTEAVPRPVNPQVRMNNLLASRTSDKTKIAQPVTATVVDSHEPDKQSQAATNANRESVLNTGFPLTIESVVNNYRYRKSRSKVSLELFITPTVSYRKLTENQAFLNATARSNNAGALNYISVADINSVVTHKPDVGLEIGMTAGLPVSRNLKFTAGLQLNVSKYDIQAYSHTPEMATIALNTGAGGSNSVSTVTNYRNLSGSNSNWLQNLYVSASVPLGAEFKLAKTRNAYIGVGATIQPTYILSDRVYLISTDYKNYAEVPSLVRRWNVNTSFETFVGYNLGHMKWRIGPQVRYQLMSSFEDKYPVREHLFDYGLKLGLMLR